jgi:hypothetical protein
MNYWRIGFALNILFCNKNIISSSDSKFPLCIVGDENQLHARALPISQTAAI